MRIFVAIAAVAALGLAACSQADQNAAEQDVNQATEEIGAAANEAGEAVEGAVNDAATEVEHATDDNPTTN
jgi:hypothetical protein